MVWVRGPLGRSALCGVGIHRQTQHPREPYSRDPRLGFCRPHAVPGGSGRPFRPVGEPTGNARVDGYGPRRVRMGLERSGSARRRGGTGALGLATGIFGWVYNLTDSGAVLEARWVPVGCRLLFSVGWVVLGVGLLAVGTKRSPRPQAGG